MIRARSERIPASGFVICWRRRPLLWKEWNRRDVNPGIIEEGEISFGGENKGLCGIKK